MALPRRPIRSLGQALVGERRAVGRWRLIGAVAALAALAMAVSACGGDVPTVRPSGSRAAGSSGSPSGPALGATSDADHRLSACKGTGLKAAIASWGGTAGSRFASVVVTSKSGVTCTVRGKPGVRLLDAKGKILLDSAKIAGIGGPRVLSVDPVVVLGPGDELALDVQWTNWCTSQPGRPLTVALVLTDRGGLLNAKKAKKAGDDDAPTCAAKKKPSQLRVVHAWVGPGL